MVLRRQHFNVNAKRLLLVSHTTHSSTVLVTILTVITQLPNMPLHLTKTSCVIMMSGAPCEDGTYCDTGRADATGGYCTLIAQAVANEMTPTSAPALAPAPSAESTPEASTQANQECSATGMSRSQG